MSRVNVFDFGARGDGVTDDTQAIQEAINRIVDNGGGTVFFPYTREGYIIARPAVEEVNGKPTKSQLYIDSREFPDWVNICLEGEMPVAMLYDYQVRPYTTFTGMPKYNTRLISTWEAPEQKNPSERPYSILSTVEGKLFAGKFGTGLVTIKNLEFRGYMNPDKMYPTGSCVNLQNTSKCIIQDCYFGLDKSVGDAETDHELQPNPGYTAALIMSGDQNDDQVLRNVGVQGYKYGFVLGEMVVADYLIAANCEEAIVFHDASHLSFIQFIVAQHNKTIVSAFRQDTFGLKASNNINVEIGNIDFETGHGTKPSAYDMQYGVYDPDNRIMGYLKWMGQKWESAGGDFFPVAGAANMKIIKFGT
ncbi:MAG: glycosyl hydrolase family 28-related protein [Victivallales bacterium]